MSDITALLARLDHVRGTHDRWTACCPAHQDNNPSLSIRLLDDGRVLIHCHAGCGAAAVLDAVGLDYDALYPETFHVEHTAGFAMRPRKVEHAALILDLAKIMDKEGHAWTEEERAKVRASHIIMRQWRKFQGEV